MFFANQAKEIRSPNPAFRRLTAIRGSGILSVAKPKRRASGTPFRGPFSCCRVAPSLRLKTARGSHPAAVLRLPSLDVGFEQARELLDEERCEARIRPSIDSKLEVSSDLLDTR